ncbi:SDR family NAD(P)-dependent oxidoreductase [Catenulispora subtropica]|uniref:SDR family NAD(P)-dependent oxidoreductase n=1 Tax=Catenulispora subtropica TaxID=450798 RepID=A0ABP5EST8_9ACTN
MSGGAEVDGGRATAETGRVRVAAGGPAPAKGRVALVTGASSGIGAATAAALARRGYRVVVQGRDERTLAEVATKVAGVPVCADLSRAREVERLAERALEVGGGRVDILVNNAGVGWMGAFDAMPTETVGQLLAVDLAAPIALTRALVPGMRERGFGRVVFVGSIAGRLGVGGEAVYAGAKAGLDCFAESIRGELRGTGVAVSVVVPGVVATPFFERRGEPYTRRWPRPVPAGRVADAVVRCVEGGAAEAYVPRWLRVPVVTRAVAPGVYRWLAGRFG